MSTREEARDAKNAFIESLGGNLSLFEHGVGAVATSGDKYDDWHVRVMLTDRGGSVHVPEEINGVQFVSIYLSQLKALQEKQGKNRHG